MDCDNCKHKICWEYAEPCSSCTNMTGVPTNWEPQSNADRIRAMTDEELAMAICTDFGGIPWCKNIPECQDTLCVGCVVKWLKQEATE